MNQRQSEFPSHQSGLNYAFSDEPILLNGMKVIFDQSTSVYPVNLQHKNGNLFNTSLARSLSKNTVFSGALSLNSWQDVQKLEIGDNNNGKYRLNDGGRLDTLVDDPWNLDQDNEGNCGFAAVIMAMLFLAGNENNKQKVLQELLKAIYYDHTYKQMEVTKKNESNNERQAAVLGVIKSRLEKRLEHYKKANYSPEEEEDSHPLLEEKKDESPLLEEKKDESPFLPQFLADYVLNVGLMLFFKDHLKNNGQKNKKDLWEEIMKFNSIFPSISEQAKELQQRGSIKKLKDMNNSEKVHPGYKKGDLALTTEGLLELCKLVGITTQHYHYSLKNMISLQTDEKIQRLDNELMDRRLEKIKNYHEPIFNKSQKGYKWSEITFPCIVGIYRLEIFKEPGFDFDKFLPYNFLLHWMFMPTKDEVWTWGNKFNNLSDVDVKNMVPIEVIEVRT